MGQLGAVEQQILVQGVLGERRTRGEGEGEGFKIALEACCFKIKTKCVLVGAKPDLPNTGTSRALASGNKLQVNFFFSPK